MHFDLLIKGGHVVDPDGGRNGVFDVAITAGKIAALEREIPADRADQIIHAAGQYVTPGLVDMHAHVFHSSTYWGIHAEPVAARSGVTTWADAGSAGGYKLTGLWEFIAAPSLLRMVAFINIASVGLTGPTWELANLAYCDTDLCVKMIEAYPDFVCGIKVRIDVNTTGSQGIEPLRLARRVADQVGLPLMVHIGTGPPTIQQVLDLLGEGDILTHCFTGQNMRIVDDNGDLIDEAKRALDMGVVLDVGHGVGGLSFASAAAVMENGYRSFVISSDLHQASILGPVYDLPTCLSKFMALGMDLEEVIQAATSRPAALLGLGNEVGSLRVGAAADVALFKLEEGRFPLYDAQMEAMTGKHLLRNSLTLLGGTTLPHLPDPLPAPWMVQGRSQRLLVERGHTPEMMAP